MLIKVLAIIFGATVLYCAFIAVAIPRQKRRVGEFQEREGI